jgi:GNAT superfamily N-acetyltransferase
MGLNYTAVDQPAEVTAKRIAGCVCFVAEHNGSLVGTATVRGRYQQSDCAYYAMPGVAIVNQIAVHPEAQGRGIGSALLSTCSSWARQQGYERLALDTAVPAIHLVALYKRLGFEEVAHVQWSGKVYQSVVLSRQLSDAYLER